MPRPLTESEQLEDAMIVLLGAIAAEHEKLDDEPATTEPDENDPAGDGELLTLADLAAMTKAQRQSRQIAGWPVRAALFQAVRPLGERLHELGENLFVVHDRVVARAPNEEDADIWTSVIDKSWNGLGDWSS